MTELWTKMIWSVSILITSDCSRYTLIFGAMTTRSEKFKRRIWQSQILTGLERLVELINLLLLGCQVTLVCLNIAEKVWLQKWIENILRRPKRSLLWFSMSTWKRALRTRCSLRITLNVPSTRDTAASSTKMISKSGGKASPKTKSIRFKGRNRTL